MRAIHLLVLGIVTLFFLSSCEKAESPVKLPPAGDAQIGTVSMGENYETQIYYDFATGSAVKSVPYNVWDLAFESDADGCHVFINDAKNIFSYNTHITDAVQIANNSYYYSSLSTDSMAIDKPCGLPDSTAIGDWCDASSHQSKKEVYVLRMTSSEYKKIVIQSVTDSNYVLAYGALDDVTLQTITIPKNTDCNYSYFSFDAGGMIVTPEPAKETWDIVFTYYRHFYNDLQLPYLVSGVLLNPYKTTALADSATGFENINYEFVKDKSFSNFRNTIGYDWKSPKIDMTTNTATYTVDPLKCYVVKNQSNEYWKIHFIGFYNANNEKGNPTFEFLRIQ